MFNLFSYVDMKYPLGGIRFFILSELYSRRNIYQIEQCNGITKRNRTPGY